MIFDYRFKRLEIMAMAVGESLEAAKAKQSRFVQGYHELDSARLWISAEVWPCPICACHNPSGMLICLGCESYCLFQKEGETCVFSPIGKQALLAGTATILRIVRPRQPVPSPSTPDVPMGPASPSTPVLAEEVPGGASCGTALGSPTSEAEGPEGAGGGGGGPAEAEAGAGPQVAEAQEAPAAPVAAAAPAEEDRDVDEQARMDAAEEVLVGFRPDAAIRSAVYGLTNVRSMFVGVYKRTMDLLKWQMRWTCNTFVGLDEMIRLGSVPWIRGKGIVTYSNIW